LKKDDVGSKECQINFEYILILKKYNILQNIYPNHMPTNVKFNVT